MPSDDSVSLWIGRIKQGDEAAAQSIWERFFPDLVAVARNRLAGAPCVVADEEDVVLSAMKSFFKAAERGRFPRLLDGDGLWRLLSEMTRRKAVDQIRRVLAERHGGGRVQQMSQLGDQHSNDQLPNHVLDQSPTPELASILEDNCRRLLSQLDPDLQLLALAKLQGYTNEEVAAQLGWRLRTVERRMRMIRKLWEREV